MKFKNSAKGLIVGALYLMGILAGYASTTNATFAQVAHTVSASEVVALTNGVRTQAGVDNLKVNSILSRSAQMKANDMAEKSYFAHANSDGQRVAYWLAVAGYGYRSAGENLAKGYFSSGAVVNAWTASSSHYANMVNGNYQDIGIGIAPGFYNGNPTVYVVQHFGQPKVGQPVIAKPVEAAPAPLQSQPAPDATRTVAPAPRVDSQPVATQPQVEQGSAMPQIIDFMLPTALAYEDSALRFDILNSNNSAVAFQAVEQGTGDNKASSAGSEALNVLLALLLAAWLVGSMIFMYIPQVSLVLKLYFQKVEWRFLQDLKPVL